jgi:hypothetical protein
MKKLILVPIIILLLSCTDKLDKNDINEDEKNIISINQPLEIEGIYLNKYRNDGLKIEILKDGNYKFSRIIYVKDNELVFSEMYTAYVIKNYDQKYLYYWHTGRYEDIPDSDSIIVYDVEITNNVIVGKYFFPEEPGNPGGQIEYYKE